MLVALTAGACSKERVSSTNPVSPTPTCSYTLSSTTFNIAGTGGTVTLAITAPSTCDWSAISNASFVTVSAGANRVGSGTVSITVAENSGDARTGTVSVGGQTVTFSQAAGDQLYGNWSGTVVKGAGCPAALPASVTWTGTFRRTGAASSELVINIPSVGVVNQTIPVIVNGSSVQFFVPIDTLYTFNATLSSDRRSLSGTFTGGGCSGTWSGARS
jgi:hypothetical protein